jgi:hypothetical protein
MRRAFCSLMAILWLATGCGSTPPAPGPLLQHTGQRMQDLKGFHFKLQIGGYTGKEEPVQSAEGDARPPDLRSKVVLRQGSVLIEIEIIITQDSAYLKSFTGGWQKLTPDEMAAFFDPRGLFDRQNGLFAALSDTMAPSRSKQEKVDSHSTYVITGRLPGSRLHKLLQLILEPGDYSVTYWIESPGDLLWRATLKGNLFNSSSESTMTFNFSKHDQSITVTAPPLG